MTFCVAGVALGDILTCLKKCRNSFCVTGCNTFASLSEDELDFSSQAQHFGDLHRVFFAYRVVRAASSGDKVQIAWQAWDIARVSFCMAGAVFSARPLCVECYFAWRAQYFGHSTLSDLALYIPHSKVTLHSLHPTLYTLHSTLYTLHLRLHAPHFTLYIVNTTLPHFTLHFALRTLHFTLRTPHFELCCAPHFTLYTPHFALYTPNTLHSKQSTLPSLHFRLQTLHFTLYTPHFALYNSHCALYSLHFAFYT